MHHTTPSWESIVESLRLQAAQYTCNNGVPASCVDEEWSRNTLTDRPLRQSNRRANLALSPQAFSVGCFRGDQVSVSFTVFPRGAPIIISNLVA